MLYVDAQKTLTDAGGREFELDVKFTAGRDFTVITGASGAGKTSLLQLVAGILRPDSGSIRLNDQTFFDDSLGIDIPVQDRRVGFVFQDYALFPHMTALQNIAYGVRDGDRMQKAVDLLETFHLGHTRNRRPHEMSGGEQQRAALARALASDPSIMLLDEPLSAVDVKTRLQLLDEIEAAQSAADIPFLYVTHNEAEADRLGGSVVRMDSGRTVSGLGRE